MIKTPIIRKKNQPQTNNKNQQNQTQQNSNFESLPSLVISISHAFC